MNAEFESAVKPAYAAASAFIFTETSRDTPSSCMVTP
jgi:hypothetical protein